MKKISFSHGYDYIISLENLLQAWQEFIKGKRGRKDTQEFELDLMANIITLNDELVNFIYQHSGYQAFNISDPKPRNIHKASVRDRLLHHAIYRQLYPFFDKTFIVDSFSCRNNKGTHKAINRFRSMAYQVSKNNTKTVWVLKCDIKKFFANIDHNILKNILVSYIPDQQIIWLLNRVIDSFETMPDKGLPLGNLTSQLLVNIYMNEFDQFVKHQLKQKYYIRYADDFVFLSENKESLINIIKLIKDFLGQKLQLQIHPNKISLTTLASGVDYLGYVNFPHHRVLRTKTKRRMLRLVNNKNLPSYLGVLKHANCYGLEQEALNRAGLSNY
ncbi:MAG: reverse transcriptase/maturase family protein [Candidatus Komeilibacteria bacterium]|nr:reverse transcriptase/maturase family protein [Candidatus Komeilibacteria bacterium]